MARVILLLISLMMLLTIVTSVAYSMQIQERESPHDRISEDQIHVHKDKIVIDVPGASWTRYADTNSMDPFIDEGANGIEIVPKSEDELYVGDVVAYESSYASGLTVHRIVDIKEDDEGKYFVLRGDNLPQEDPERVRFSQIRYVLIGILY